MTRFTDIVVGQDVAGTDDHSITDTDDYRLPLMPDGGDDKGKTRILKGFQSRGELFLKNRDTRRRLEAAIGRSSAVQVAHETFASTEGLELSQFEEKGKAMKKLMIAVAAAATLGVSSLAASVPAQAQHWHGAGPGVAAGLIGGAIVGSAIANSGGYYGPGYGYYGGPAYVAGPGYYGGCYWQRQRFWDGYGWRFRRVRTCY
jgi:hypothetical protein